MKKLPVGISDFKTVIEGGYYYVDKSLLLKEMIERGAYAVLFPRPRRFGKTLNLSMIRYFYEKTETDTSRLFRHLKIWQAGEEFTSKQGKYPVVFLTFKDVKEATWERAVDKMTRLIQEEFSRHDYLLAGSTLKAEERKYFSDIANRTTTQSAFEDSLRNLSRYLARHHNQKVVLLIDEYDTPIQAGYVNGYYDEVVGFMRSFLSAGLKDNLVLEIGVITGIMRVAKESIFSGLNNLSVFSLLRNDFCTAFGLTEAEVEQALRDFQLVKEYENLKKWYNGYVFGGQVIYNPWSIINYLDSGDKKFLPYWVNTSDNAIIERLLTRGGAELKADLESLIRGESIEQAIEENIVFRDLEKYEHLLWSFLLFSGYLKYETYRRDDFDPAKFFYRLVIPNQEVRTIYLGIVARWFSERIENRKLESMLKALIAGNVETFEALFAEMVKNSFSFWDAGGEDAEKVYQAFVIGLLVWLAGRYEVKSNGESGYGRYDVMLIPKDVREAGIIIEFKKVNTKRRETKERALASAFQQIKRRTMRRSCKAAGLRTSASSRLCSKASRCG